MLRTHIAYGSPNKQDSSDAHGAPLGEEEVRLTKKNLGCPEDECFCVPEDPLNVFRGCTDAGITAQKAWIEKFAAWAKAWPELAGEWNDAISGTLPLGWETVLPDFQDALILQNRFQQRQTSVKAHLPIGQII